MNKNIRDVCKIGQGSLCCRYLTVGVNGFECEKKGALKSLLDHRVQINAIVAKGDNCDGKSIEELNDENKEIKHKIKRL